MQLNPPQKLNFSALVAGGIVVTVVVVLIALASLKGLVGKLSVNNQVLSKKRQAEQQLAKNLTAVSSLSQEYSSLGSKKTLITDALPTDPNFPGIVSMMENLSKNAGVSLVSVTPAETGSAAGSIPSNGPTEYDYSASITGGYKSFKSFLHNVEISLRPLAITSMKISGNSNALSVDLTIRTYYEAPYDASLKTVPLKEAK